MKFRKKMTRRQNKKNFSKGNKVNPKNLPRSMPMRGGIRM